LFYALLQNISFIWRRHHYRWRAAKFRPMLGAQGLWALRDLYRATPAVTQGLSFSGLIRGTVPLSRLWRQTRGCGKSILMYVFFYLLTKALGKKTTTQTSSDKNHTKSQTVGDPLTKSFIPKLVKIWLAKVGMLSTELNVPCVSSCMMEETKGIFK
jgi:hypothetical protein